MGELVEEHQVLGRVQECLMIVLAMQVHEVCRNPAQYAEGCRRVVDERPALGRRDLTPDIHGRHRHQVEACPCGTVRDIRADRGRAIPGR